MRKPESPCVDCEMRNPRCHAFCGLYEQYIKLNDEYKETMKSRREELDYARKVEWSETRRKQVEKKMGKRR